MSELLKQATIFHTDTKDHFIASAYMLGDLVAELGKDNIIVNCFHYETKKKIKDEQGKEKEITVSNLDLCKEIILKHFKIPEKNVSFTNKALTLFDRLEATIRNILAGKDEIHVINMPTTQQDKSEHPKEVAELLQGQAQILCDGLVKENVEKQKPKDDKEREEKFIKSKISPMWRYQFMDVQFLVNNLSKHGLTDFFKD